MISPLAGIALVLALLGGLIGALWLLGRRDILHPELSRKGVHIGMGLVVLSFPWLFSSLWPVAILGVLAMAGLAALRLGRLRTEGPGQVLLGVNRISLGEFYFPAAVVLLFWLSRGDRVLYSVPLLILGLADALAALVGVRMGTHRYTAGDATKSVEGSLTFLATAFLCVFLPLIASRPVPYLNAALIALMLGLIVTALEAISLRGRDNLFIPLGSFVLLKIYPSLNAGALTVRLAALLALLGAVLAVRRRTTLDDAALLGAVLTGYAAWAVGGWPWLVPPVVLLLTYTTVFPNCYPEKRGPHNVHAVVSVTAAGYLCLLLFAGSGNPGWYFPFCLAYCGQLAMVGVASLCAGVPRQSHPLRLLYASAASWLLMFAPFAFLPVPKSDLPLLLAAAGLGSAGAAMTFYLWQPDITNCPADVSRWFRQGTIGLALSLCGSLLSLRGGQ